MRRAGQEAQRARGLLPAEPRRPARAMAPEPRLQRDSPPSGSTGARPREEAGGDGDWRIRGARVAARGDQGRRARCSRPPNLSPPLRPRRRRRHGEGRTRGPPGGSAGRGRGSPPASSAARAPSGASRVPAARAAPGPRALQAPGGGRRPSLPPPLAQTPPSRRARPGVGGRVRLPSPGPGPAQGLGRARRAGRGRGRPRGPALRTRAAGRRRLLRGQRMGARAPAPAGRLSEGESRGRALRQVRRPRDTPWPPPPQRLPSGAQRPGPRFRDGSRAGRAGPVSPPTLAARAPGEGPEPPAEGPAAAPGSGRAAVGVAREARGPGRDRASQRPAAHSPPV